MGLSTGQGSDKCVRSKKYTSMAEGWGLRTKLHCLCNNRTFYPLNFDTHKRWMQLQCQYNTSTHTRSETLLSFFYQSLKFLQDGWQCWPVCRSVAIFLSANQKNWQLLNESETVFRQNKVAWIFHCTPNFFSQHVTNWKSKKITQTKNTIRHVIL